MGRTVGIDLGTTYSAVSVIGETGLPEVLRNAEGQAITPSAVFFDSDGVLVGQQAKSQRIINPEDVVEFVKRYIGDPSWAYYAPSGERYTPESISALILKKLVEDAQLALGEPISNVVITVPAYFNDAQRMATRQAGEIAGLQVDSIINEPTAAAISYAVERNFNGTLLVYDLGGGTFDVTLLESKSGDFNIVHTAGDRNLGGFDFDNAIINWIRESFAEWTGVSLDSDQDEAMLRERAEQAKHRLSSSESAPIFISAGGHNEKFLLTREKFESLTAGLLSRTEMLVEEVIDEAGVSLSGIDRVLLVGGSTRMPMVAKMMERLTGQVADSTVHPDEAVARGAAIVANVRSSSSTELVPLKTSNEIVINDVVSHGLGVVVVNSRGIQENSVIIPANTTIPSQVGREYYTSVDNQTSIEVSVTEGDEADLRYVKVIGDSTLKIPPHPRSSPVKVIFSCDIDGILHIEVIDLVDDKSLGEFEIDRQGVMNVSDVKLMRSSVTKTTVF
ncbi:Hsp70 family protein [Corynebacterium meridianum]|uniref:Hsp70 family protein n=1 Tax=Corynebacterium meridianum TaxID=2765363 RepID=A0A934HXM1_9CORY|nr:Hsp70 family protein [Corynebacterium meridianum]MBI8988828.1 Hsp70 family protein [Corynebacterium meridianum]